MEGRTRPYLPRSTPGGAVDDHAVITPRWGRWARTRNVSHGGGSPDGGEGVLSGAVPGVRARYANRVVAGVGPHVSGRAPSPGVCRKGGAESNPLSVVLPGWLWRRSPTLWRGGDGVHPLHRGRCVLHRRAFTPSYSSRWGCVAHGLCHRECWYKTGPPCVPARWGHRSCSCTERRTLSSCVGVRWCRRGRACTDRVLVTVEAVTRTGRRGADHGSGLRCEGRRQCLPPSLGRERRLQAGDGHSTQGGVP